MPVQGEQHSMSWYLSDDGDVMISDSFQEEPKALTLNEYLRMFRYDFAPIMIEQSDIQNVRRKICSSLENCEHFRHDDANLYFHIKLRI